MGLDDSLLSIACECASMVIEGDSDSLAGADSVLRGLPVVVRCVGYLLEHLRKLHVLHDMPIGDGLSALLDEVA